METTKRHLGEVMERVDHLQWQQLTTYDDARYLVRALREVQAERDTLKAAMTDCVDAMDAMIGRRETGFAIEEIIDAARAALAACVPPQEKP